MHWYKVVKEVRGNRYLYLQHSYRIGGRKNPTTLNIYCGRADDGGAWKRANDRKQEERNRPPAPSAGWESVEVDLRTFLDTFDVRADSEQHGIFGGRLFETFGGDWDTVRNADPDCVWTLVDDGDGGETVVKGLRHVNRIGYFLTKPKATPIVHPPAALSANEISFIDELLDMSKPFATQGRLDARWDLKPTKARPWAHVEAYEIAPRMGVTVKTLIGAGRDQGLPVYNVPTDTISLPDATRYRAGFGMSAQEQHLMSMLHETVHATMKRLGRPQARSYKEYFREELVAEIGAWVVARRLGCAPQCHDGGRKYLEGYWGTIADRDEARAWVEREVAKAADFIVAHHRRGGWKPATRDAVCPDCGRNKHPDATVCTECFPA